MQQLVSDKIFNLKLNSLKIKTELAL